MRKNFPGGRRWPPTGFIYHKAIEPLAKPPELSLPLWYGGRATVSQGDRIKTYDVIGQDREGLPVHAPLGGKVKAVGEFPHLLARPLKFDFPRLTVFIEVDRKQSEEKTPYPPKPRFWELTHQELCQRLLEAGVMDVCHQDLPRAVIYNALDLEPPLSANLRLLEEKTPQVLEGMRILNQLHGAVHSRIALSSGFPRLEAKLRAMLASAVNLSLHIVEPIYPQGNETLLKREIFPDEHCTVYSTAEALRVQEAVVIGRPVVESYLTAWNGPGHTQRNLSVPIGTAAGHVLWSDGMETKAWRPIDTNDGDKGNIKVPELGDDLSLVFGGLLSGKGYYSLEMPVQFDTKGLLLKKNHRPTPSPCINCGACHCICPARLHPSEIYRQVARQDIKRLRALGLDNCLSCGLCSWACPSKIELFQQIAVGRMLLEGNP